MADRNTDEAYMKMLGRLRTLCSRREYCCADMLKKAAEYLSRYGYPPAEVPDAASRAVEELKKDRYLDDLRYSSAFAADKSSLSGWGPVKIRYALNAKGISRDIIGQALDNIEPAVANARLEKLAVTRLKSLSGDPQWRLKLLKFLLGRGYSYEDASKAADAAARQCDSGDL